MEQKYILILLLVLFIYYLMSPSVEIEGFTFGKTNSEDKEDNKVLSHDNHIYFYADVNRTSIMDLVAELRTVSQSLLNISQKTNTPSAPIYLHINSYGGSIFAATAGIDHIISCPVPVYTIVEGAVASAATLLSVVGKKRYIKPHAHMLIHQLSSEFSGKAQEFEDEMKNIDRLMELIKAIYKQYTEVPESEINQILKHDLWWSPEKCLEYKLVDEILV
jgi:ATP-dependent Clp endopeptidase proteolytic subunit ClpP